MFVAALGVDELGGVTVAVALCVAVAPLAPVATSVNVVVAERVTSVDPLSATAAPLSAALTAFVVCHVTRAVVAFCMVAVIAAVGAGVGAGVTVAVALREAVAPLELVATSVNVVVVAIVTGMDPLSATAEPFNVALTAFVVCHVTRAVVAFCMVAVIVAVGAGVGAGVTVAVALREAVAPLELVATSVNVVVVATVTDVDPLSATAVPLIVALTALVVCHDTSAVVAFCMVAVICAVGAAVARLMVASFDGGPTWADVL